MGDSRRHGNISLIIPWMVGPFWKLFSSSLFLGRGGNRRSDQPGADAADAVELFGRDLDEPKAMLMKMIVEGIMNTNMLWDV